jgi:anti-sigma factor RsiW
MNERSTCERGPDLIAFLYGEADEREARDFQLHLLQCSTCREEVESLGVVRQSITAWRDEALAGFVSTPVTAQPKTKSALAALRQFFDLSPLWLKGATAFAAVTFCVLAGLVLFRGNKDQVSSTNVTPGAVYTEHDVNRIVKEALAQQTPIQPPLQTPSPEIVAVKSPKPKSKSSRPSSSTQFARGQRPLSKAEREQLAAELRLLSAGDDATLHLLGDRINQ